MSAAVSVQAFAAHVSAFGVCVSRAPATGMVPLLFLNTKKKKQLKHQELIREVCTLLTKQASVLGCDDVTLFVANPQLPPAAESPDKHLFSLLADGSMVEYLPPGRSESAVSQSPIGRPDRVLPGSEQQSKWLSECQRSDSFAAGVPFVAQRAEGGVVVLLPVLGEKGQLLGVVQLTKLDGAPASGLVAQAQAMASHVACVLRNWVDATMSPHDDDDDDAPAGTASAKQLEFALAMCFKPYVL